VGGGGAQAQALPRFGSCAAVMGAKHLKGGALGHWIDRHDAVMRVDLMSLTHNKVCVTAVALFASVCSRAESPAATVAVL